MPASMRSMQFHGGLELGSAEAGEQRDQAGAANPVHQGVSEVSPLGAQTFGTVAATTAWRTRKGQTALPQPLTSRNAGSVFKFSEGG